ncbi:NAD(P)/FAD-dependent oxidoreductase [Micromonospora sp. DT81.3]|uniref:NAD(P)/FAD-dependent oxidoreductase n=1 Tax=Micromonospora sp. DT81.3 TaxID=3416523 RepID=UPI003CFAEA0B
MRVLVVGGGFAGAMAAVRLAGRSKGRVEVTVVNPRAAFVNRIRMHHVAVGRPVPFPSLSGLLGSGVTFVEGYVTALEPELGRAEVSGPAGIRTVSFDRVILATGSTTERAPIAGHQHVYGVGDIDAAHGLRPALASLSEGSTVTVVGGGLTGLETVAEIAESRTDLDARLLTAGEIGGWFDTRGQEYVRGTLARLRVDAVGGTRVRAAEPGRLHLDSGIEVPSDLTVWCGGFAAPPLPRESGIAVDEQGAVLTDAAMRSISHPSVLAVGDSGHAPGPRGGRYSMSCQFAFPSGAHAADVLLREALDDAGENPGREDADALDLGFLGRCVSLGRRAAILQLTDKEDVATGRSAVTGRTAVMIKRVQLAGMAAAVSTERRVPGLVRWPKGEPVTARHTQTVTG